MQLMEGPTQHGRPDNGWYPELVVNGNGLVSGSTAMRS